MNNINILYKNVAISDIDVIIKLMHEYYDYDNIPLNEQNARKRLNEFIKESNLGKIWLIEINNSIEGYIVVTNGFGLEHGRNVTIDEFYIRENFRGYGVGPKTLRFIEQELSSTGIKSIHAEVERKNYKAQEFWEKTGFQKYDRFPMKKMINNT